ncbi:unnamed protein product [Medioppia subpectinata]|uniref:C2H2-type domain-containing protein n=1 Tax=Medioppia subpectinata TaxID=1979941 RepID=A0A7R9KD39_9ACAR|nr:unnamed protein product [Medioppia subpectinata]CAG2100882.1 unnamed protein product [Medioppia subpectinata]
MPQNVDNAYGLETINGRVYYECFLCDKLVVKCEKDIVRHVFRDHLRSQSVTTTPPTTRRQPVATGRDSHASGHTVNSGQKSSSDKHIQPVPKQAANDSHQSADQLNDHDKSVATISDQNRDNANTQSKSLRTNERPIASRSPAHTSGQSLLKRRRNGRKHVVPNDQKLITDYWPVSRLQAKEQTTKVKTNGSTYQTSAEPLSAPTTDQSDDQPMDNDFHVDTKRFSCLEKGCGKTFGFMQSLIQHRLKHSQRVNKTAANLTTKANTIPKATAGSVRTSRTDYSGGYKWYDSFTGVQKMGHKWYKVHRLNDRSVNAQKESHRHDLNYRGLQSLKNLTQWYRCYPLRGQRYYRCLYETACTYGTYKSQQMAQHLHCLHIQTRRFPCRTPGCGHVYLTPQSLRQHERNHRCGFGTGRGGTLSGPCGNRNIFKYRIVMRGPDGRISAYECAFCHRRMRYDMAIKRHIHNQHLCPERVLWVECPPPTGDTDSGAQTIAAASGVQTFAANDDSDGDDIQILDESLTTDGRRGRLLTTASPEVKQWLRERSVSTCTTERYAHCMQKLERLARIRPLFERRCIDGLYRYVCKECHFAANKMDNICLHLRLKHFVN